MATKSSKPASYHVEWILTTPSSAHITTDLSWFTTYTPFTSSIGNPYTPETNLAVHGVGTVNLRVRTSITNPDACQKLELRDVLYVPDGLNLNVVSMSLLHNEGWREILNWGTKSDWFPEHEAACLIKHEGWECPDRKESPHFNPSTMEKEFLIIKGGGGTLSWGQEVLLLATPGRTKLWLEGTRKEGTVLKGETELEAFGRVECCWTERERRRWEEFRRVNGEGGKAGGWTGVGDESDDDSKGKAADSNHAISDTARDEDDDLREHLTDAEIDWVNLYYGSSQDFLSTHSFSNTTATSWNLAVSFLRAQMAELDGSLPRSNAPATEPADAGTPWNDEGTGQYDGEEMSCSDDEEVRIMKVDNDPADR